MDLLAERALAQIREISDGQLYPGG